MLTHTQVENQKKKQFATRLIIIVMTTKWPMSLTKVKLFARHIFSNIKGSDIMWRTITRIASAQH